MGRKSISIDIEPEFYKIGLRRLGIADSYKGEKLVKEKKRKTHNLSKQAREKKNKKDQPEQLGLFAND